VSMSPTWADGPMATFDLETTGVDPETARIVTASVITIEPGVEPSAVEYVMRQGKPDDVDRSWPIRPFGEPQTALIPPTPPTRPGGLL
jgi:DNA polymerase III epsilon subunit-like protein